MRLRGKTALVTGAARGIGRAIVDVFAREGATIAACDQDAAALETLAEELTTAGVEHLVCVADVSEAADVDNVVALAVDTLGHIDVLVNNAGVSYIVPFLSMDDELWDRTLAVNLRGTYLFCQAVLPHMIARRYGRIVNMSSQSGKQGNTHYAAYCASKAGIIALTQSIALEFAENGITVNAVCPGVVFTPLWEAMAPDYARKRDMPPEDVKAYLESKIPMKRFATSEEVACVALFLASDEAAYMTGQSLNVTGGGLM